MSYSIFIKTFLALLEVELCLANACILTKLEKL